MSLYMNFTAHLRESVLDRKVKEFVAIARH